MYNGKEIKTRSTAKINKTAFGRDKVVKPHIPVDPAGYWNPANWGKPVTIPSGKITGKGINQPLIGIDNLGTVKSILPGQPLIQFPGNKVTEYPMSYFDIEVDDDMLAQYKANGFLVEDLNNYQEGGESYYIYNNTDYMKKNGKWYKSVNGTYMPLTKGDVKKRSEVLEKQAYKLSPYEIKERERRQSGTPLYDPLKFSQPQVASTTQVIPSIPKKEFKTIEKKVADDKALAKYLTQTGKAELFLGDKYWNQKGDQPMEGMIWEEIRKDPDIMSKIDKKEYERWLKEEKKAYAEATPLQKGLNAVNAFISNPELVTHNLIFGSEETGLRRPLVNQHKILRDKENSLYSVYNKATGYENNWLDPIVNVFNPGAWAADAYVENEKGNYVDAYGNLLMNIAGGTGINELTKSSANYLSRIPFNNPLVRFANDAASTAKNMGETLSYELNTLGKKLNPNYQKFAQEQLDMGNQWSKDWWTSPATTERINQMIQSETPGEGFLKANLYNKIARENPKNLEILSQEELNKYFPEREFIPESSKIVDRINQEKWQSSFQPGSKKIEDFLAGKKRLHQDNYGIYSPLGDFSYVDKYSPNILSTAIHEGTHKITKGNDLLTDPLKNQISQIFNSGVPIHKLNKYFQEPTEVHARIMELRKHFGLKPGEIVDDIKINEIMNKGKKNETPVDPYFFNLIKNPTEFKKAFNTLPAIIPAAGAAGAGAYYDIMLDDDQVQQYKNGGFVVEELPKAQSGNNGDWIDDGGNTFYAYAGRPDSYYRKINGKWQILNESTNGKFIYINDPKGTRAKELNKNAYQIDEASKKALEEWGMWYQAYQRGDGAIVKATRLPSPNRGGVAPSPYGIMNPLLDPKYMTSQQLQQKANNMAPTVEGTKWLEMAAVQKQNEQRKKEWEAKEMQRTQQMLNNVGQMNVTMPSQNMKALLSGESNQAFIPEELPYTAISSDNQGNVSLISKEDKQKAEQAGEKMEAFKTLLKDREFIEKASGENLKERDWDKRWFTDEGDYNYDYILGKYYNKDFLNKVEELKYQDFLAKNQKAYDEASTFEKGLSTFNNFVGDPIITLGNWMEGKGTIYGQSGLLRQDDPTLRAYARRASSADDYWLNDYVNWINPGAWAADIGTNLEEGDYGQAALEALSVIPFFKGAKAIPRLTQKIAGSTPAKTVLKGLKTATEAPILRTTFKPSSIDNVLLQQGESSLGKSLLDANLNNAFSIYSTAALPQAIKTYTEDPTASNFVNIGLLAAGSPLSYQTANVVGTLGSNAFKSIKGASEYVFPYGKTVANMIKGNAPLSWQSFKRYDLGNLLNESRLQQYATDYEAAMSGTGRALSPTRNRWLTGLDNPDAFKYGRGAKDLYGYRFPQTRGSAVSYNVKARYPAIADKIAKGEKLTSYEETLLLGANRSIPSLAEFESNLAAGAYSDFNLTDDLLKDVRTAVSNPESYHTLDIYKQNPTLQGLLANPTFVNKSEYLLPFYPKPSAYKALSSVDEYQNLLTKPVFDFTSGTAAIRGAALDRAAAERMLVNQQNKVTSGRAALTTDNVVDSTATDTDNTTSTDSTQNTNTQTINWNLRENRPIIGFDSQGKPIYGFASKFKKGGSKECPEGYVMYQGQCVKWEEPEITYSDTNQGTGYDALTNMITRNVSDKNQQQDWWMEHEKYHHLQNLAGAMSSAGYLGQRPNPFVASDQAIADYYDVRPEQVEAEIDKMIAANPMLQFIPREKLRQNSTPIIDPFTGKLVSPFIGADSRIYSNPTTIEGDARIYEQSFKNTGKSIFPKMQFGGTNTLNPAYEGPLTEEEIKKLKEQGFHVEDIDLHLPKQEEVFRKNKLLPYGFVDAFKEEELNNLLLGAGVSAMFDTPLKQLSAGFDINAINMTGFQNGLPLYNNLRVNPPMLKLNYTIPYKSR